MNCRRLCLLLSLLLVIFLPVPGCNSSKEAASSWGPVEMELSFPNGAPALNETAELVYTVWTSWSLKGFSASIDLPEAFELVSGELSWRGDIPLDDESIVELEVIKAVVRAVETGNCTIKYTHYIDPDKHGGLMGNYEGPVTLAIYVSVSEDSAEWAPWCLWHEVDPSAVPIEQVYPPSDEDD